MNKRNNERGAALVIVLGIIMLLMIFGATLAAQMTNTQKQLNVTDRVIDARNLARMGLDRAGIKAIKAFEAYDSRIDNAQNIVKADDKKRELENALKDFKATIEAIGSTNEIKLDTQRSYSVGKAELILNDMSGKPERIKLKATGYSYNKDISEESTITIQDNSATVSQSQ